MAKTSVFLERAKACRGTDVASLLGVNRSTLHRWVTERDCPRRDDGSFDLAAVIAWRCAELEARALTASGDPLLAGGGDSPNLERYRAAKAELAELDVGERRNSLIPRDELRVGLGVAASAIRRGIQEIDTRFGSEASGIMTSALESCLHTLTGADLAEKQC